MTADLRSLGHVQVITLLRRALGRVRRSSSVCCSFCRDRVPAQRLECLWKCVSPRAQMETTISQSESACISMFNRIDQLSRRSHCPLTTTLCPFAMRRTVSENNNGKWPDRPRVFFESRSCGGTVKQTGLKDIRSMQSPLGLDMVSRSQQSTICRSQRNYTTRLLSQMKLQLPQKPKDGTKVTNRNGHKIGSGSSLPMGDTGLEPVTSCV